jgi:hypothetical protein
MPILKGWDRNWLSQSGHVLNIRNEPLKFRSVLSNSAFCLCMIDLCSGIDICDCRASHTYIRRSAVHMGEGTRNS